MTDNYTDEYFMKLALKEARKGKGFTRTNPLVGAVIVKQNKIISKGFHKKFGGDHAEVDALKKVHESVNGATLYVTLEPCSTRGKTPPCTDAILKSGIKRVVISALDPNPIHKNRGVEILKSSNIDVSVGLLKDESLELNKSFTKITTRKRPYVCLKMAMSLDGKIATANGDSRWITNEQSRKFVHKLRNEYDAILVGKNTALSDNPSLTVRDVKVKRQPDRILMDSFLKTPLKANFFKRNKDERFFCVIDEKIEEIKIKKAEQSGAILIKKHSSALKPILEKLLAYDIGTVLVEGGSTLAAALFKEKLIDKIMFFYAPKIIGNDGIGCIGNLGIEKITESVLLENIIFRSSFGNNFLVEAEPNYIDNL